MSSNLLRVSKQCSTETLLFSLVCLPFGRHFDITEMKLMLHNEACVSFAF